MRILATLLSVIITGTLVIGLHNSHQPGCRLCNEERINKIVIALKTDSFEDNVYKILK